MLHTNINLHVYHYIQKYTSNVYLVTQITNVIFFLCDTMLAWYMLYIVCPFIDPSQVGILQRWLNLRSQK